MRTPTIVSYFGVILLSTIAIALNIYAQPSGGPYGSILITYPWPSNAPRVYVVSPDGLPDAPGTLENPTTIESAIARASTGEAIVLRGGTYRTGDLVFNQGITIQPHKDEKPILKGTLVATNWVRLPSGLWRTTWTNLFPARPAEWWHRAKEGVKTPMWLFNNDMVFVDGKPLKTVGWEGDVDTNSFYIDYENKHVYIGVNPTGRVIEITAWDVCLLRTTNNCHGKKSDGRGFTLKGITLTQYAYRAIEIEGTEPEGPADPATYGKDVVGTTLENVTITHCSRVAAYLRGDNLIVRNCLISDTSTEGLYILASSDCLLERNIFMRNNVEKITGYYPAAVKIFNQCHRVTCRDNLVTDQPDSNGIWYDVGNVDGVFINNWIENCIDGFFFEISKGAICAGNVFVNCHNGIRVLNSCNVRMYHNTLVNTPVLIERTPRSAVGDRFGWHPATGPDVDKREGHEFVGNFIVTTHEYDQPLLKVEQTPMLCNRLTNAQLARCDYNLYVRGPASSPAPLYKWSPTPRECFITCREPAELTRIIQVFETRSVYLNGTAWPVIKSIELKQFQPVLENPLQIPAEIIPHTVYTLLGWPTRQNYLPGAYQR